MGEKNEKLGERHQKTEIIQRERETSYAGKLVSGPQKSTE